MTANEETESEGTQPPDLNAWIETAGRNLDRLIAVSLTGGGASYFELLFQTAGKGILKAISDWEHKVENWCGEYWDARSVLLEINLEIAVYIFDQTLERVTLACGLSSEQLVKRDTNRMRRFPDVNIGVRTILEEKAFLADRGHFLDHASCGVLDIKLFPRRREFNRGWSAEEKRFRAMERHVADHPGTFFYHLPHYDDETWIPATLEYGVLVNDPAWGDVFGNK